MNKTEPNHLTLEQLSQFFKESEGKFEIFLHRATKWITWISPLAGDPKLIAFDAEAKEQLTVTFSGVNTDTETIEFDPRMKFYMKRL